MEENKSINTHEKSSHEETQCVLSSLRANHVGDLIPDLRLRTQQRKHLEQPEWIRKTYWIYQNNSFKK